MARLSATERAALPDRAFAYIDSSGRRLLPIVDAQHVRNALARFGRVAFESDEDRDEARRRLLTAAKRFRIVPVGFIDAEVRSARVTTAEGRTAPRLPSGFVTMLMSDIEGSTGLLEALGDDYGDALDRVQSIHRAEIASRGGHVVEIRADDAFAAFESPGDALRAAIAIQRAVGAERWPGDHPVRVRIGVHAGYPTVRNDNYVGMAVHTAARISDAAHGGQILISAATNEALSGFDVGDIRRRQVGTHRLRGIPDDVRLIQVWVDGLSNTFPALRLRK
jgi:class 3 adenylate cyclase